MEKSRTSEAPPPVERGHGGRMVLKNYFKWLDSEDKKALEVGRRLTEVLEWDFRVVFLPLA